MSVISRVRQLTFLAILVGALSGAPAQAFDPECPDQGCGYCPAEWSEECYIPSGGSATCGEFGCFDIGTCDGGLTRCYCDPCENN